MFWVVARCLYCSSGWLPGHSGWLLRCSGVLSSTAHMIWRVTDDCSTNTLSVISTSTSEDSLSVTNSTYQQHVLSQCLWRCMLTEVCLKRLSSGSWQILGGGWNHTSGVLQRHLPVQRLRPLLEKSHLQGYLQTRQWCSRGLQITFLPVNRERHLQDSLCVAARPLFIMSVSHKCFFL